MSNQVRGGMDVTDQQAAVVDHLLTHEVTVVGAGAGSGKTRTTVASVLEILGRGIVTLDQFVLITFTTKAADELRDRLEQALRNRFGQVTAPADRLFWREQQERLAAAFVGTIHGFCSRMLRTFGYDEQVAREADITFARMLLIEAETDAIEASLGNPGVALLADEVNWEEHDLRKRAEQVLAYIQNRGLDVRAVVDETRQQQPHDDPGKSYRVALAELVAEIAERYLTLKQEQQAIDAHDLLVRTATMLVSAGGQQVIRKLAERYRYLFIDEFQDTDRVQKQIVDALRPALNGILVVGDRKQSIYGFRSADVSLMEDIASENGVPVLPLSISRRPTQQLLNVQNALFSSMSARYPDLGEPLDPWNGISNPAAGPAALTYLNAPAGGRPQRITTTGTQIQSLLSKEFEDSDGVVRPIEEADIVILVRSNSQLREYQAGLRAMGLDVRQDTGGNFFTKPEIVSTYHILRLVLHYPDDTVLSLALRTPYLRDASAAQQEQHLLQYGSLTGTPLTDWFEQNHPEHAAKLKELRTLVRTDTAPQLLARILEGFRIREHYANSGDVQAAQNLERFRELARELFGNEQALSLRQFVSWLQLAMLTGRDESEALLPMEDADLRPPFIRISTIHRAKGLEFPIVIIPEVQCRLINPDLEPEFLIVPGWGLDAKVPVQNLNTQSARFQQELLQNRRARLEEEMRIFYVAVTRAQHAVVLVGDGSLTVNTPTSDSYSWKDEILQARSTLVANGARFA